jgi:5-methylcytosine-specific restriction endonuclease McrA
VNSEGNREMTGSSSWITKHRRLSIYIRDSFTCQYCGRDLKNVHATEMGLDHLDNLVDGGGHRGANNASTNLITACRSCNSARGNRDWRDYAPGGAQERIEVQRNAFVNIALAKSLLASGTKWSDR